MFILEIAEASRSALPVKSVHICKEEAATMHLDAGASGHLQSSRRPFWFAGLHNKFRLLANHRHPQRQDVRCGSVARTFRAK